MYAIDIGGTNFRVKHVQLSKRKSKIVSDACREENSREEKGVQISHSHPPNFP